MPLRGGRAKKNPLPYSAIKVDLFQPIYIKYSACPERSLLLKPFVCIVIFRSSVYSNNIHIKRIEKHNFCLFPKRAGGGGSKIRGHVPDKTDSFYALPSQFSGLNVVCRDFLPVGLTRPVWSWPNRSAVDLSTDSPGHPRWYNHTLNRIYNRGGEGKTPFKLWEPHETQEKEKLNQDDQRP